MSLRDEQITRIVNVFFGDERHRRLCEDAIRKALREVDARPDHGYILGAQHMSYDDLIQPGTVTILVRNHGVKVGPGERTLRKLGLERVETVYKRRV